MPDTSIIFAEAIEEHLKVIQALQSQQPVLERIAMKMAAPFSTDTKSSGAEMEASLRIPSTSPQSSWDVFARSAGLCRRLR